MVLIILVAESIHASAERSAAVFGLKLSNDWITSSKEASQPTGTGMNQHLHGHCDQQKDGRPVDHDVMSKRGASLEEVDACETRPGRPYIPQLSSVLSCSPSYPQHPLRGQFQPRKDGRCTGGLALRSRRATPARCRDQRGLQCHTDASKRACWRNDIVPHKQCDQHQHDRNDSFNDEQPIPGFARGHCTQRSPRPRATLLQPHNRSALILRQSRLSKHRLRYRQRRQQ